MASEKNPGIHFHSGFREKTTRGGGGVQFEILKNPGIDFYSGLYIYNRGRSRFWQWGGGGGKILSVAHKSVADPGFEVTGAPLF